MFGDQIDIMITLGIGLFVTFLGWGGLGKAAKLPDRNRATMRKIGPLLVVIGGLRLVLSLAR